MDILVWGLLSVVWQCQVAKNAANCCFGWLSMMVFSLMSPLKVHAHNLDKEFVIGKYYGMGLLSIDGNAKWPKMLKTFALDGFQ